MDPRSLPGGSSGNPESTQMLAKHERGNTNEWGVGSSSPSGCLQRPTCSNPVEKWFFFFFQYTHNEPWPWAWLFKISSFYYRKVHTDIKVTRRGWWWFSWTHSWLQQWANYNQPLHFFPRPLPSPILYSEPVLARHSLSLYVCPSIKCER